MRSDRPVLRKDHLRSETDPLRIALAIPHGHPFIERVFGGIIAYAQTRGGWNFSHLGEAKLHSSLWLRDWDGDGAFVWIEDQEEERELQGLSFPIVNLSSTINCTKFPTVAVDHQMIGQLGAEHLAERHFKQFAYVGVAHQWYSQERRDGFSKEVKRRGGSCDFYDAPEPQASAQRWRQGQRQLDDWLRQLKLPVAIMTCSDLRASIVIDACARLGLQVPNEVAVLGVDNAVLTCETCRPTLSSVSRNDHAIGLAAAGLLERLIIDKTKTTEPLLIAPGAVIQRQSSDVRAISDPDVAMILSWVNQHIGESFGVAQMVKEMGYSRRHVEGLFQSSLGCSPYRALCQERIEHACRLLPHNARAPIKSIASACGLPDANHFRTVFMRLVGVSPQKYRAKYREKVSV